MKSEKEIQHLIDEWITRSIDFLEKDERGDIRKQISKPNQLEMDSYLGKKCPTCTEKMTRKNPKTRLTTEHIVPRCLGGNNIRVNLVAMCHHCNRYRNAVMLVFLPPLPDMRGTKLEDSVKADLSRFIEWSLRTIHTPDSKRIDAELSELFAEYSAPINNDKKAIKRAKKRAKGKTAKSSKKPQSIASDDVLEVLKEILETQKAILERLQKSPLHRFRDWIVGFIPKRKPRQQIERKSKLRRSRQRRDSKKKGEKNLSDIHSRLRQEVLAAFKESEEGVLGFPVIIEIIKNIKQESKLTWNQFCAEFGMTNQGTMNAKTKKLLKASNIPHTLSLDSEAKIDYAHYKAPAELDYEYFCPTCDTLFKKWKEARLHKEKTGHGCRHCKDCGDYFLKEKLRKVHEEQTGHTNYSGQFHAKNRMSIKHYLPEERSKQSSPPSSPPQYPIIEGLNNSKGTFRLPRDPGHLGAALIWIAENVHSNSTFSEMREEMASKTNIAKSRVHYLLTKISVIKGGENWLATTATSNMDAIVIVDALQTHVYQICLAKQIEVTEQYTEYFSLARNYILEKAEEE